MSEAPKLGLSCAISSGPGQRTATDLATNCTSSKVGSLGSIVPASARQCTVGSVSWREAVTVRSSIVAVVMPAAFRTMLARRPSIHWPWKNRSEEHTSELQSLMRISYAVFCLKKKTWHSHTPTTLPHTNNHTLSTNQYYFYAHYI